MKKLFLGLLFAGLLISKVFAAGSVVLVNDSGVAIGTSTNPMIVNASGYATAGWVDDGTGVRLQTITDKVGIGKSDPLAKLDIRGAGTGASTWALRIADTAGTDRLVVLDNGNVGIGTTSPIVKLDINGSCIIRKDLNTSGNVEFDYVYTFNGVSTYVEKTTEAKTTLGNSFGSSEALWTDTTHVLFLGKANTTFNNFSLGMNKVSNPISPFTIRLQYYNGTVWNNITSITDNTLNMTQNGVINFTTPSGWTTTSVNNITAYWINFSTSTTPNLAPDLWFIRPKNTRYSFIVSPNQNDNMAMFEVTDSGNIKSNNTSISTPATIVVGRSTSRNGNRVDFICSGSKDQIIINNAISALPTAGGRIILLEGTYSTTANIDPAGKQNIELCGMGIDKTIIKLTGNYAIISNTTAYNQTNPLQGLTIRDMTLDGSSVTRTNSTSRKAIFFQYLDKALFENLFINATASTAIGTDFMTNSTIRNNVIANCGNISETINGHSGIGIGSGAFPIENLIITGNHILNSGHAGILIESQGSANAGGFIISNNYINGSYHYGIKLAGVQNVLIESNIVQNSIWDGVFIERYSVTCNNLTILNNKITDNAFYGINVTDVNATNIMISNNDMRRNANGNINNLITNTTQLRAFNNGDSPSYLEGNLFVLNTTMAGTAPGTTLCVGSDGALCQQGHCN